MKDAQNEAAAGANGDGQESGVQSNPDYTADDYLVNGEPDPVGGSI